MDPELMKKQREYEARKHRTKLALNICTICGKKDARPCNGCGTTSYCSTDCQRIDWRDRGHRKACKKVQAEREEAKRAEAPPPPRDVFYGPAPRSHADEIRARIAAEHEAARVRREANPEPVPSSRVGSRCPICFEDWDVNLSHELQSCCCRAICTSCFRKIDRKTCPLCRSPPPKSEAERLARYRRHAENEVPEALVHLGDAYCQGWYGFVKSGKKAAKLYRRAMEAGSEGGIAHLGFQYEIGDGVKLDKKKATQLYRLAAERGYTMAQFNLANMLYSDDKEGAAHFFKLSAEKGLTQAQHNYAVLCETGSGVERDLDKAKFWFSRAAAKGHEPAMREMKKYA